MEDLPRENWSKQPFLSTCYGDTSDKEVPVCCEATTKKSAILWLNVPLSQSTFKATTNPRKKYHLKISLHAHALN